VVNLSGWHSVLALEALVSDGWKVHVSSFLCDLNSLELSIMEIISIVDVLDLCWVNFLLQGSEVVFIVFAGVLGLKCFFHWEGHTAAVFFIDRFSSCLRETLSIQVLGGHLRNVASVPRDVLGFHVGVRATDPVLSGH